MRPTPTRPTVATVGRRYASRSGTPRTKVTLPEPFSTRLVRCANENDDRHFRPGWEYANPHFERAQEKLAKRGLRPERWCPAINARVRDRSEMRSDELVPAGPGRTAGFFYAMLWRYDNGTWRVSCVGGDDFGIARGGMTEAQAMRVWARVTSDHVTIRTLRALGLREE